MTTAAKTRIRNWSILAVLALVIAPLISGPKSWWPVGDKKSETKGWVIKIKSPPSDTANQQKHPTETTTTPPVQAQTAGEEVEIEKEKPKDWSVLISFFTFIILATVGYSWYRGYRPGWIKGLVVTGIRNPDTTLLQTTWWRRRKYPLIGMLWWGLILLIIWRFYHDNWNYWWDEPRGPWFVVLTAGLGLLVLWLWPRFGAWVGGIAVALLLISYGVPESYKAELRHQAEVARTKEATKSVISSTKPSEVITVIAPVPPLWSEWKVIPNTTRFVSVPNGRVIYETLSGKILHDGPDIRMSWGHGLGVADRTFHCKSEEDYSVVVEIIYEP